MDTLTALLPAGIITAAALYGLLRGVDVFAAMSHGVTEGLRVVARIFPPLVGLLTAVAMLRASGALDALTELCAPLLRAVGIPPETAMLLVLRPISGSGALAAGADIISSHGADSLVGRTAAVMLGSTETTFYVLTVYFGAVGIKKSRWAIPAALGADLAGFLASAWTVRLFWG
jgi:spore maturation protein B